MFHAHGACDMLTSPPTSLHPRIHAHTHTYTQATPRDLLPIPLQRAWVPIDLLEEEYVHYLEGQRNFNLHFEGQTTAATDTVNAGGATGLGAVGVNVLTRTQLMYLKQLALHYTTLATAYEGENMFADSVIMTDRSNAISNLCAANAPKVEKRGRGWSSGAWTGTGTGTANVRCAVSAANSVTSSATNSAASTPRVPYGAPQQCQFQVNSFSVQKTAPNTGNTGAKRSSRRGSASSNLSRSAMVTPRDAASAGTCVCSVCCASCVCVCVCVYVFRVCSWVYVVRNAFCIMIPTPNKHLTPPPSSVGRNR
jgi:hypothetical protein